MTTSTNLLQQAKDYLRNMNDSAAFDLAMEIQSFLDKEQFAAKLLTITA